LEAPNEVLIANGGGVAVRERSELLPPKPPRAGVEKLDKLDPPPKPEGTLPPLLVLLKKDGVAELVVAVEPNGTAGVGVLNEEPLEPNPG